MFCFRVFGDWDSFVPYFSFASVFASTSSETSKRKVQELGGNLFFVKGKVVEVVLNKTQVEDEDLTLLVAFPDLKDLSLGKYSCRGRRHGSCGKASRT